MAGREAAVAQYCMLITQSTQPDWTFIKSILSRLQVKILSVTIFLGLAELFMSIDSNLALEFLSTNTATSSTLLDCKSQPTDGIIFTLSPQRQTSPFPQKKKEKVKFTQDGERGPLTLYLSSLILSYPVIFLSSNH